jgi:hypothetical protein
MNREARIGVGVVVALGAFVALMLVIGNLGEPRAEVDPLDVAEVLAGSASPEERWGSEELHVVGWYAELDADCVGDDGGADESVAWLQRECPLRVLMPEQPPEDVTQAELERDGLRLAAPLGNRFPSRAEPGGPNLRSQQLVFVGHFADEAATRCVPERQARCESTFVVTDYDELFR